MRVLIVDDDASIGAVLKVICAKAGLDCTIYTNPLLAAEERDFDICISDYSMPSLDGIALITRLKPHNPQARFALVTAFHNFASVKEAKEKGLVDTVLGKPWNLSDLRQFLTPKEQ